ncbi:MAG: hypothetical protein ONB31_07905 [candidate division KSB1 bacterium]|nr:hypothetical protein [candidate division KSB1 bacterium]MDZ7335796.1 hypothetical protein [candidate division KSB1 bacterium]MDZ7358461.1 hypothetical protein [candidate division KSB1 bacterium]MDZ7402166.1 hypothetical protein [candidate division KSB1 bacterium]
MKANTIEDALRIFDPNYPLIEEDDIKAYYVDRDPSPLAEIKTILKTDTGFPKVLLSGPPGCGKSTELGKLKEDLKKEFHAILLPGKNFISNFEFNLEGLISKILKEVGAIAKKEKLPIGDKIDKFLNYGYGWEISKEVAVAVKGGKATEILLDTGTIDKISKDAQQEQSYKEVLKQSSKPGIGDMISLLNEAIEDIDLQTKKDVLVLVPNMDKISIENAKDLFTKSLRNLIRLPCFMVYTFPLMLKYDPEFITLFNNFNGIYYLSHFAIEDRLGHPNEKNRSKLKEIITKRMPSKLIFDDAIEKIVTLSGGIVFELVKLVRQCCIVAMMEKIDFIDEEVVDMAEVRIRNLYKTAYSKKELEQLLEIRQSKSLVNFEATKKLFMQMSYTEYGLDDEIWYDVNPILFPLLEELGLEGE